MSDFVEQLGEELEAVVRRRANRRPRFAFAWSRRTLALALIGAVAMIAVPAAAVTGVFERAAGPPPGVDPTNPIAVPVGPPCVDNRERKLQTTADPPPADVTQLLAVLRRAQQPSDRLSGKDFDHLATLPIAGVNPDAIRRAATAGGTHMYVVPAENVRYFPPPPDTEACKRFKRPEQKPIPGVCLIQRGRDGGATGAATCSTASAIRRGLTMLTSGTRRHGLTRVAGLAHDGASAVIWRVRRGKGFLDTRIPVRNNVYAATVPGRAGRGLRVYFETADGRKAVSAPHRFTKRELAQLRLNAARDKAAGRQPTVFPRQGAQKALFILRMRVPPENKVYVAAWKGPHGTQCANSPNNRIGMRPALSGPQAGLIRLAFGPPAAPGSWCPGTYTGTVRLQRRGSRDVSGPVVARFSFVVRPG
jgi:hypothetical protein